ncbi:MAG: NAD regulator [Alphaproteobacteria bacterium]
MAIDQPPVALGLTAVVVRVDDDRPQVLVASRMGHDLATDAQAGRASLDAGDSLTALPFGPFDPAQHRTMELGLKRWVAEQTGLSLRYIEQLYTFGNRDRDPRELSGGPRVVTTAYLALVRDPPLSGTGAAEWADWYTHFPWEDWRSGCPSVISTIIQPALTDWLQRAPDEAAHAKRSRRIAGCFDFDSDSPHAPNLVLERFELLYEAGLVMESHRDRMIAARLRHRVSPRPDKAALDRAGQLGLPLALDNRRMLAAAIGRIRGKLDYRPVVFDLLPPDFTLGQLQRVVESMAGFRLHSSNFRRMVISAGLVEETGAMDHSGRGRPAKLFRYKKNLMTARVGIGLPAA